jgi:hypothetical protein
MTTHRSGIRTLAFESWDTLWDRAANFRRGWRVSSVIWGVGLLVDAMLRVVFAYALPVDLVPALSAAQFPVTMIALSLIDQIN